MECSQCQWDNSPEKAFCSKCDLFLLMPQSQYHLATIGKRIWATILDFIMFIVTLGIGYVIWFIMVAQRGQTPGKQLAKEVCINKNGKPLSFWRMVLREIIGQFLFALITGGIFGWLDELWALWDKDRQTLHDKMAGSWVVDSTPTLENRLSAISSSPS